MRPSESAPLDERSSGVLGPLIIVTGFVLSLIVSLYHLWAHEAPLLATILGQAELFILSILFGLAGYYALTNVEASSDRDIIGFWTGIGYALAGLASGGYAFHQHLTPEAVLGPDAILFQATFVALIGGTAGAFLGLEKAKRGRTVADLDETTRELEATQADIRTEKQRFESLFQNAPTAIADLQYTDGEPIVDRGNTAFEDLIERTSVDVEGKHLFEVVPLQETATEKEVAAHVRENEIYEGEVTVNRSDEQGHYKLRVIPYEVGKKGERAFALYTDVTELRRTQQELAESVEQLKESERRYQTLVENFPNGVVALVDEDLRYVIVGGNPQTDQHITVDDPVGQPVEEVVTGGLADELVPRYEAALDGETSVFEYEHENGEHYSRFHVFPVRDDGGDVFAALGMSQDITDQREYERKLEESNERLEQFAYGVSHDLQEPLRMVSSYLQLLEDRYTDDLDQDAREFIDFAVDGANRMRAMIDSLLEYSRVTTRGEPMEPTDAEAVLDDVLTDLQPRIGETDAMITADGLPTVIADPDQLAQVLRNLISNALTYSGDEPPRIHVGVERVDDEWQFAVADQGIGIDPDQRDRLFEVFETLHTAEEGAGSGIGLAICERIVERHGGDIWVESDPGEGSTFYFTIPITEKQQTTSSIGSIFSGRNTGHDE